MDEYDSDCNSNVYKFKTDWMMEREFTVPNFPPNLPYILHSFSNELPALLP